MLSSKTKGLFVEVNPHGLLCAVTSSVEPPLTIESLQAFPVETPPAEIKQWFSQWSKSKAIRFQPAQCGAYPKSRFFLRHTMESPAKAKDPNYFPAILQKARKDPQTYTVAVHNAVDGMPFDPERNLNQQKEIFLFGAEAAELLTLQNQFIECGLFPSRLEMATAASIGGIAHYARFKKLRLPTLVLEINPSDSLVLIVSGKGLDICRDLPHGLDSMLPTIRQELGLKDDASARKLLSANTFDFTENGGVLLSKIISELQASIGFYEVQTGQSIGQLLIPYLAPNFAWIREVLSSELGMKNLRPDYSGWFASRGVDTAEEVDLGSIDTRWHSLLCLIGEFSGIEKEEENKDGTEN
jgi:hypothetical protein